MGKRKSDHTQVHTRPTIRAGAALIAVIALGAGVVAIESAGDDPVRVDPPIQVYDVDAAGVPVFLDTPFEPVIESDLDGRVIGTIDGQRFHVRHDPTAQAVGIAVWFHGQNGDIDTRMESPLMRVLVDDGWVVAASEMRGNSWGNHEAVKDVTRLVDFARTLTDADRTLYVAASMGGLASLNSMRFGQVEAHCWWGTQPVVDLDAALKTVNRASDEAEVAFGETDRAPYNPRTGIPPLPEATYRVIWSPDDVTVLASEHTALLSELVPGTAVLTDKTVSGPHNSDEHFDADDLRSFAADCA